MCGICGIIKFDNKFADMQLIREMMAQMKHRGPDDEGTFQDNAIGLGFVRLSILDLSPAGHQPMQDDSERYVIIFNGEIYNYIELREELKKLGVSFRTDSDTEVLLKAYIYYGESCLGFLNGMFSFVIYDKKLKTIFAARDRFGVKPFYYYKDEKELIFASEIPSILAVYNQKNEANESIIFDYLAYNRTDHTEDTFFKGIKKMQHGHCMTIKEGQIQIKRWYDLSKHIHLTDANPGIFKDLLISAVKLRMRSDVPVGVCLSGGLDSSAITAIISNELNNPQVNTFSVTYEKGQKGDESEFIDVFRDNITNMHFVTPTAEDLFKDLNSFVKYHAEPIPSTSPYAQYQVMKLAKEKVTVTLDGQGADEHLAGYSYFYGYYFKDLFKNLKLYTLLRELLACYTVGKFVIAIKSFLFFLLPQKIQSNLSVGKRGFIKKEFIAKNALKRSKIVSELYASKSMHIALLHHFEYKLEHLLKWNDRNSMAHSVESRTPFLDYRLVEYSLSLENASKIRNGYTKSIMREALKGILPEKIRLRKDKVGFGTPQDEWFRNPIFKAYILDILSSDSFKNRNIINVDFAKKLYSKHLNKEIDISNDIWKWIHLELWYREFIDPKEAAI